MSGKIKISDLSFFSKSVLYELFCVVQGKLLAKFSAIGTRFLLVAVINTSFSSLVEAGGEVFFENWPMFFSASNPRMLFIAIFHC